MGLIVFQTNSTNYNYGKKWDWKKNDLEKKLYLFLSNKMCGKETKDNQCA